MSSSAHSVLLEKASPDIGSSLPPSGPDQRALTSGAPIYADPATRNERRHRHVGRSSSPDVVAPSRTRRRKRPERQSSSPDFFAQESLLHTSQPRAIESAATAYAPDALVSSYDTQSYPRIEGNFRTMSTIQAPDPTMYEDEPSLDDPPPGPGSRLLGPPEDFITPRGYQRPISPGSSLIQPPGWDEVPPPRSNTPYDSTLQQPYHSHIPASSYGASQPSDAGAFGSFGAMQTSLPEVPQGIGAPVQPYGYPNQPPASSYGQHGGSTYGDRFSSSQFQYPSNMASYGSTLGNRPPFQADYPSTGGYYSPEHQSKKKKRNSKRS